MPLIEPAQLHALLTYDAQTGQLTWKPRPLEMFENLRVQSVWNARYANKLAGSVAKVGYISIRINDRAYYAHRIIWAMILGAWPADEVDHINGDRLDNRLMNLRLATRTINAQNLRSVPRGQKLPMGVYFHARKKVRVYSASIEINGRSKHLGYFDTPQMAQEAYLTAKRIHHPGCTI